jgi:hypothetical protein
MGERVLFQVVRGEEFSPVIYCHWSGDEVRDICDRLRERMKGRGGDVQYTAARLVQECINGNEGNLSFGIWNADSVLTETDSHGDGGVVLVDVSGPQMEFKCFGGYWVTVPGDYPRHKTREERNSENFYSALKAVNS